jgi:hypothetical protein
MTVLTVTKCNCANQLRVWIAPLQGVIERRHQAAYWNMSGPLCSLCRVTLRRFKERLCSSIPVGLRRVCLWGGI